MKKIRRDDVVYNVKCDGRCDTCGDGVKCIRRGVDPSKLQGDDSLKILPRGRNKKIIYVDLNYDDSTGPIPVEVQDDEEKYNNAEVSLSKKEEESSNQCDETSTIPSECSDDADDVGSAEQDTKLASKLASILCSSDFRRILLLILNIILMCIGIATQNNQITTIGTISSMIGVGVNVPH